MVQQRKRSPSVWVAWVRFRTRRHIWTELVGSMLCSERLFSPRYSPFSVSWNKGRLINVGAKTLPVTMIISEH